MNKDIKKIQKEMMRVIKENNGQTSVGNLGNKMNSEVLRDNKTGTDIAKEGLRLLIEQGKCEEIGEGLRINSSVRLKLLGWQEFDAWYKKLWRFFTNDIAKILSITAVILSIISIIFNLLKR